MPKILILLFLLLFAAQPAMAVSNHLPEYETAAKAELQKALQAEENGWSAADIRAAITNSHMAVDKLLNRAWKETMGNLKSTDPGLAGMLLADQRTWLKFAERFTDRASDNFGEGGSMYRNMAAFAKLRLWVERISYLRIVNRTLVGETVY